MRVTAAALSLNVPDVEASADFVRRHLGFATAMEADGFVSLSRPDTGFDPDYVARRAADGRARARSRAGLRAADQSSTRCGATPRPVIAAAPQRAANCTAAAWPIPAASA